MAEALAQREAERFIAGTRDGPDPLLPFLTTRAEMVLTAAKAVLQEWAAEHLPGISAERRSFAAESIVRLVVSHMVLPTAPPEHTAGHLADAIARAALAVEPHLT
jgi:hypothetical protein